MRRVLVAAGVAALAAVVGYQSVGVQNQTVTIAWDASVELPLGAEGGYVVAYGTDPANMDQSVEAGNALEATVALPTYGTYYFAVKTCLGTDPATRLCGPYSPTVSATRNSPVESPEGTRVPPAASLTRRDGSVFTIVDSAIYKDGQDTGGRGSYLVMLAYGGALEVHTLGTDNGCWVYVGSAWQRLGDWLPCQQQPPPPPPATDEEPPVVYMFTAARRSGQHFPVTARATDNVEVDRVEFYLRKSSVGGLGAMVARLDAPTTLPDTFATRIQVKVHGTWVISARAVDTSGNVSAPVSVTVQR
jgi:hypothetical protein